MQKGKETPSLGDRAQGKDPKLRVEQEHWKKKPEHTLRSGERSRNQWYAVKSQDKTQTHTAPDKPDSILHIAGLAEGEVCPSLSINSIYLSLYL